MALDYERADSAVGPSLRGMPPRLYWLLFLRMKAYPYILQHAVQYAFKSAFDCGFIRSRSTDRGNLDRCCLEGAFKKAGP